MQTHSAELIIARNFPGCDEYDESSFTGYFHEDKLWNDKEYWLLEWAVYALAEQGQFERDLVWRLFNIFSYTLSTLGCHFDSNDLFRIENRTNEEVYELRERFKLVFEGFFSGNMPDQSIFQSENPLVVRKNG